MKYIVIIWHQAGGDSNNQTFYAWSDEQECAYVFDSEADAKKQWREAGLHKIHAGTIVQVGPPKELYWI